MAIAGFGVACRSHFPGLRRLPPSIYCSRKVRRIPVAAVEILTDPKKNNMNLESARSKGEGRKGRRSSWKLSADELGINTGKLTESTAFVLNALKGKGYDVYLVGGCVRDLILNRTPKDFDILTSATLYEVLKTFPRHSRIVGKWFPICHVHVDRTTVEVSSFSTVSRKSRSSKIKLARPPDFGERDYLRWKNCLRRDFTINGLMLDPYAKLVYDYMGGVEDIRKAKVRTVIPPDDSFREDCARILRAVRIAARLGFRFSKETAYSIRDLSSSVMKLDKGRLLMEMNYMLAFGSAEASLRLLWKVGLLEMLLPFQAAYFVSQGFRRRDKRSNMLLSLFSRLDKLLAPDRPCNDSLWVAILAFHKAILDHPRDPLVVAVFVLTIYSGGNLSGAVKRARSISHLHDHSFPELLKIQELDSAVSWKAEVIDLASSVQTALWMMSDGAAVSQAMAKYPKAPDSDLVFISQSSFLKVCEIFDCTNNDKRKGFPTKQKGFKPKRINYEDLAQGEVQEVRQLFARVVFDTIYPTVKDQDS